MVLLTVEVLLYVVHSKIECFRFVHITGFRFWRNNTLFTEIVRFLLYAQPQIFCMLYFTSKRYHIPKLIYAAPKIRMANPKTLKKKIHLHYIKKMVLIKLDHAK